ncbi:hypothetical protein ACLK1T_24790 [Escherichia coli]
MSNTGDDLDVIRVAFDAGMACVHVLLIRRAKCSAAAAISRKCLAVRTERGGGNLRRCISPAKAARCAPYRVILLDFNLSDKTLLADSLSELAGRKINVQSEASRRSGTSNSRAPMRRRP